MLSGKLLRQILDKMMKSPVSQEARVQIQLPDGQYFDIECWDDDMEKPRTATSCAIYPVYPTNQDGYGMRTCDGTKWIRLFTNKEEA